MFQLTNLDMDTFNKVKEILKMEEGFKSFPYTDTQGKLTIGFGFNLTDVGISKNEADYILASRLINTEKELSVHLPVYLTLDNVRKCVLLDCAYNLGVLGLMQFHDMISALNAKNYKEAAEAMRKSLWFRQVGYRGEYLVNLMETGIFSNEGNLESNK